MIELLKQSTCDLLCSGGDSRTVVDPVTRRSRHGWANEPEPDVIPFGSCTASTISNRGLHAAIAVHELLRQRDTNSSPAPILSSIFHGIRSQVLNQLTLRQVTEVDMVLTPSGTDAELIALWLAAGPGQEKVCNIVVGPTEVGSGTLLAAGGCFFDPVVPFARFNLESFTSPTDIELRHSAIHVPLMTQMREHPTAIDVGQPICRELADRVDVRVVKLRDERGQTRGETEIDHEVVDIVNAAVARGDRVLLHVVAHSKTGVHAPGLQIVAKLSRSHRDRILVVVDAAQGRFSRRGLIDVLRRGYLMMTTGSKFYGGPPFCGAVFVPQGATGHRRDVRPLPESFGHFFAADHFPPTWQRWTQRLPVTGNPGLALRWRAALAEMHAYYASPSALRLRVLRAFEQLVPSVFAHCSIVRLDPVGSPVVPDETERLLQSKTTVFPFSVFVGPERRELSFEELRSVRNWLAEDLTSLSMDRPRFLHTTAATRIQIGQPVLLVDDASFRPARLRIALGAPWITKVCLDANCGATLDHRLSWLEQQLVRLRSKLEWIAARYDALAVRTSMTTQERGHAGRMAG